MTRLDTAAAARALAGRDATRRAEELRRIAARFVAVADRLERGLDDEPEEPRDA